MNMNLRLLVFHSHPQLIFPAFLTVSSFFSLQPTPSALPITATLTGLLVYSRILFNSTQAIRQGIITTSAIAIGGTLARLPSSIHALSSSGASISLLLAIQCLTSLLALLSVYIDNKLCLRLGGPWAQVTLFPALWSTLWYGVSSISPLGRLSAWSSTEGAGLYNWATPFWGAIGYDWVVAAWAVVCSQVIAKWYIGKYEDDVEETSMPVTLTNGHASTTPSPISVTHSTGILTSILILCAIPSFIISTLPVAPWDTKTVTPLSVGCVIPPVNRYKHYALTLDDYIAESKTITNSAKLLLWPEGAVTFNSVEERHESFERIRKSITGSYVGVSFEENFEPEEGWPEAGRRNGIAIVSQWSEEPHLIYFKRNLVPLVESYPLKQSSSPPEVFTLQLTRPKERKKDEWGAFRPIPITASICLDFAHPYTFKDLTTKPALILAPGRTWDVSVGKAMWEQARQRAEELDSMVLWCDGGAGGVSGIGGKGYHDVNQVGDGSWVKTIGIQFPFDENPSAYAQSGRATIALSWVLVFVGVLGHNALLAGQGLHRSFQERRRRRIVNQQASVGDLLDI